MSSPIVAPWLMLFGDAAVHVRDVLATTDRDLTTAISGFLPNPDPQSFSAYLRLVERRPLRNGKGSYRFARVGNGRWRLLPAEDGAT